MGAFTDFAAEVFGIYQQHNVISVLVACIIIGLYFWSFPAVPYTIPFVGNALDYGADPVAYLEKAYYKYGPVFSLRIMGKTMTYVIGDASALFFNSKNEDLNAEDVMAKIVTPVFGKGVAYDIPNYVFTEQKKLMKGGLSIPHFEEHIPMIVEETESFIDQWGTSGEKNLLHALDDLVILTASRCLQGKELRALLTKEVAQLYVDLEGGYSAAAWVLPSWFPVASFRKRDAAHKKTKEMLYKVIRDRRKSNARDDDDMLQTLMDSTYKDGRHLNDEEIAGMLISVIMAGHHTSSTSSAWLGLFLAGNQEIQDAAAEEQKTICGTPYQALTYDSLRNLGLLDRCLKESLRLRAPVTAMLRMVKTEQEINGYTIPVGHLMLASAAVNQRIKDSWENPNEFDPDRFLNPAITNDAKFAYVPFGAGRHRCIGEQFAYVQIKTIWATLLRKYEFHLVDEKFPGTNYSTVIPSPKSSNVRYQLRTD